MAHDAVKSTIHSRVLLTFCLGLPLRDATKGITANQDSKPCAEEKLAIKHNIAAKENLVLVDRVLDEPRMKIAIVTQALIKNHAT